MAGSDGVRHPHFARLYPRASACADSRGAAEHRDRLLAGLRGRVVEVGCGHGANFARYPAEVTEVVAVEPEPDLRAQAVATAREAPVPIRVVAGAAEKLPAEAAGADALVFSLVLCTVPDQGAALAEARRVLAAGGEVRFYEHVGHPGRALRAVERLLDATVWPRVAGGCHIARDTEGAIRAAGLAIEAIDRFGFRTGPFTPSVPHVLGRARAA